MQKSSNKTVEKIINKPEITGKNPRTKRGQNFRKKHPNLCLVSSVIALPLWASISLILSQYIIGFGLYFLIGRAALSTPVWTTVANALIYLFALFLTIFVPIKVFKHWQTSREELGLTDLPTWTDLGLAPVGFLANLVLAYLLLLVFSNFSFFDAEQSQELGYEIMTSGFDRVVAFFALCIVAPIAEEVVFRGWLYGKLRAKLPGKRLSLVLSILITSLTFALLHGQWNVGVNVFALSLVLCGLREITGTIYSGILVHIIKNTVAFFLLYIIGMG